MDLYDVCRLLIIALLGTTVQGFHTLCYWTVWSQGRVGDYGLKPGDIDPHLCSHLIYAFGVVGPGLSIDLELDRYPSAQNSVRIISHLKKIKTDLVTMISVGGAGKGSEAFDLPAADETSRSTFARNLITFCRQNDFDGVDIDWEYPKVKRKFTLLAQAIRAAFNAETVPNGKKRLLLSAAVSVSGERINTLYDIPALNNALDFFNIMAYDFHGSWGKFAAFNSPLFSRPSNPQIHSDYNADWAVRQYIMKGASRSKIILGLASYGRAYRLEDRTKHDVGAPIEPSTEKGPVLQYNEQRMYPEVCDFIRERRARYKFDEEQKSAFVYTIDFWIGYDNPRAFSERTKYAMEQKLGGVLIWTLDYDDVSGNHCGFGKFPLAKAIKNTILGNTQYIQQQPMGYYQPVMDLPRPIETNDRYKRVCYFLNWSTMRTVERGQFSLKDVDLNTCTHLIYSFAFIDEVGYSILPIYQNDESKSSTKVGLMETFNGIKRQNPVIRTLLAVGGTTAGTRAFDIISRDDASRRRFARNVVEYLEIWGFNGLDVVWNYPGYPPATKTQYTQLLQVLREEFDIYERANSGLKLILAISVAGKTPQIQNAYQIPQISRHVDFMSVLTYTYRRADSKTYYVSPLYKSKTDSVTMEMNQEWSIKQWTDKGVPAEKLLLGLTGMGRSFTLESTSNKTAGAAYEHQNVTGPVLGLRGIMSHYEICDFLNRGATEKYDTQQVAPYAYFDDLWVSYENRKSIAAKVKWLKSQGLGGYSFWSLDYDDFMGTHCNCGQFPLLTAAYQATKGNPIACFGTETSPVNEGTQRQTPATEETSPVNEGTQRQTPATDMTPVPTPEKTKTTTPPYRRNVFVLDKSSASALLQSAALLFIMFIVQRLYISI